MSGRSYTPQKFSPTILKRCKGVIEELQDQLDRVNQLMKQRQQQIDMLQHERNYFEGQSREYQLMTSELKKANGLLKAEVDAMRKDHRSQDEIASLKQTLAAKDKLIDEMERHKRTQIDDISRMKDQQIQELTLNVTQLEGLLEQQQKDKRHLDQQWQSTLDEVSQRIKEIQAQLTQRNEQNLLLEMEVKKRRCDCDETINEIKKVLSTVTKINMDLRARYQQLELAHHEPRKYMSHEAKITPFEIEKENYEWVDRRQPQRIGGFSYRDHREGTKSRSVTKLPTSRPRINNSAYLTQNFEFTNQQSFKRKVPKPELQFNPQDESPSKPTLSRYVAPAPARRPFFLSEQLEREVATTRATLESQYRNLSNNHSARDTHKLQHTLNELESKLERMVNKMQSPSLDSIAE